MFVIIIINIIIIILLHLLLPQHCLGSLAGIIFSYPGAGGVGAADGLSHRLCGQT